MVIDEKKLIESLESDWVLINEIASLCLVKLPEYVALIEKSVLDKNFEKLELHAHTLKGSISYFGYEPVRAASYALETSGREQKWDKVPSQLDTLRKEFTTFYKALEEFAKKAQKAAA